MTTAWEDVVTHSCRDKNNQPIDGTEFAWWEYDAQGIALCKVCDNCIEQKLAGYRPEILSGYAQDDVDEPIESGEER